jgi:hypothetical protein
MLVDRFTAVYGRTILNPPNQDVMTVSLHMARRTSVEGSTATAMDNTLRALVEARWDTFETAVKTLRTPNAILQELNWHNGWPAGPPPHQAVRSVTRNSPGTGSPTMVLPPQCAINCTLEAANRRHWGRFALGAFVATTSTVNNEGNLDTAGRTAIATALGVFLNGCLSDGVAPVVYHRPTYLDKSQTVVTSPATFYPVTGYRVDIVWDIIRRRRYEHTRPTDRVRADLTVPAASPGVYGAQYPDTRG